MATISPGGRKQLEDLKPTLPHKSRHEGTISDISDVVEMEYDDDVTEKVFIAVRSDIDDDLDVDDDYREKLREYIHDRNLQRIKDHLPVSEDEAEELAEEVREDNLDKAVSGGEEVDMFSYNYVELKTMVTAKITRNSGNTQNSALYDQLDLLDLVEPYQEDKFELLNREGDVVESQRDGVHEVLGDVEGEEDTNKALVQYLKDNLLAMVVEYDVDNKNRGTDEEFSTVNEFVSVVEDPEA